MSLLDKELPTAIWSGTFRVAGIELHCHVLSDGQRIIEADDFIQFMDAFAGSGSNIIQDADFKEFLAWYRAGRDR